MDSEVQIKKIGEDNYAVTIPDLYVDEEEVNGPQLLGMLSSKRLMHTTKETVLRTLDGLDVGHKVTVKCENSFETVLGSGRPA